MADNPYSVAMGNATQIAGAASNLANNAMQIYSMKQQQELQEWQKEMSEKQFDTQVDWATKMFDYQKLMNETTMAREDNAVQRRAADLAAAGLNPNLAVGQPASSQGFGGAGSIGVVGTNLAQRFTPKFSSMLSGMLDARMRMAQLGQVTEQSALLRSQQKYFDALAGKVSADVTHTEVDTSKLDAETDRIRHDLEFYQKYGLPSNQHTKATEAAAAVNAAPAVAEQAMTVPEQVSKAVGERISESLKDAGVPSDASDAVSDALKNFVDEVSQPVSKTSIKDVFKNVGGAIKSSVSAAIKAPSGSKRKAAWDALKKWNYYDKDK